MKLWSRLHRDPAFWVVLPLLAVLLPHFARLPLWMDTMIVGLLSWRLLASIKPWLMPHKFILLLVALGTGAGVYLHYGSLFGKTAGTAFLAVLLGIKLLESRQKRDYMLLIALSFFIMVTNFFFSQTIPTVVAMLLIVVLLVMSLLYINQEQAPLAFKPRLKMALKLVSQALPLMLIMFVLFPRIPGPLWKLPDDGHKGRTGLSDTMTPGSIADLIESNNVAFRVEFEQTPPAQKDLYWRAQVLWYFDGRTWEAGRWNLNPAPVIQVNGNPIHYTITLEPHDRRWLFALDMPGSTPPNSRYTNNFLLRAEHNISSLYQYSVDSYLDYRIQPDISDWERSAGLKLPEGSNPRTIELGQQWRHRYRDPEKIVQHALHTFNQQEYRYTLQPPLTPGFDPVDQFLFETRAGFCEHYASAFTLLMRAAGVPARVVVGYQGGAINPLNGIMTVAQSDAHAWSEVWMAGRGWVRVDPTAAIAPQRIERNLNAALGENEIRPLHLRMNVGLIKTFQLYWDALDNRWNQWVIGYDQDLQHKFLSKLFNGDIDIATMIRTLVIGVAVILAIIAVFIFKPARNEDEDAYLKLYNRFCNKLGRAGLRRYLHEGPQDFAQRASQQFPTQRELIMLVTGIYVTAKYRSREQRHQLSRMKQLIGKLKLS